jgi:hypothetical protein
MNETKLDGETDLSPATPARLRIYPAENDDTDHGNRLVYVERAYYLIAQGIRGNSTFCLNCRQHGVG